MPAYLTLFHHLPPSAADELKLRLSRATHGRPRPAAVIAGPINLGRGVALRVDSPDLSSIRSYLVDAFAGLLTPQDAAPWRAHVTIQNKVEPEAARELHRRLGKDFAPRPLAIKGLAAWFYRGGPWEPLSQHMFA